MRVKVRLRSPTNREGTKVNKAQIVGNVGLSGGCGAAGTIHGRQLRFRDGSCGCCFTVGFDASPSSMLDGRN